jgi:hypothetical protein
MEKLNPQDAKRILKLIKHPADRKAVKKLLQELMESKPDGPQNPEDEIRRRSVAKQASEIISRIGLEMFKHKSIDSFFDLFD